MMSNPLYNQFNKQPNNAMELFRKFNEFRNTLQGDPRAKVMELMQSGQLTQQKLNEIQNNPLAQMLYSMMQR